MAEDLKPKDELDKRLSELQQGSQRPGKPVNRFALAGVTGAVMLAAGFSLSGVIAPTLITFLCIEWGWPGWYVMGGIVVAAAAALGPVSRWALATRDRYGAASATG